MNKAAFLRAVVAVLLILGAVVAWIYAPLNSDDLGEYVERGRQLGAWGPVALAVLYVPVTVLLIPASWVTLAGAFAFGVPRAFAAVSVGSTAAPAWRSCSAATCCEVGLKRGWPRTRGSERSTGRSASRASGLCFSRGCLR